MRDIIVVLGLFSTTGVAIDRFMLRRERVGLLERMATWWIQISYLKVPNMHTMMAEKSLALVKLLLGSKFFSFRSIITVSTISVGLTIFSLFLGYWIGILRESEIYLPFSVIVLDWFSDLVSNNETILVFLIFFPFLNLVLDGLTCLITFILLRKIQRTNGLMAIIYILVDTLATIIIGLICFNAGAWLYEFTGESVGVLGELDRATTMGRGFAIVLFSMTTAIPTVLYMCIMLLLVLCKIVLSSSKLIIVSFLERAMDPGVEKFAPFTLFGILCGVLATFIRTAIQVLS
jgi:hypothetical protein